MLQPRHDMQMLLEALVEYKGILQVFPDVLSVHRVSIQNVLLYFLAGLGFVSTAECFAHEKTH